MLIATFFVFAWDNEDRDKIIAFFITFFFYCEAILISLINRTRKFNWKNYFFVEPFTFCLENSHIQTPNIDKWTFSKALRSFLRYGSPNPIQNAPWRTICETYRENALISYWIWSIVKYWAAQEQETWIRMCWVRAACLSTSSACCWRHAVQLLSSSRYNRSLKQPSSSVGLMRYK